MKKFDYENSIGFVVYSASKTFQKAFDLELRNKIGITITQSKVIFALYLHSGLTQRELADKIGIESPTLVPIIDKMEEDGYVERKLDSQDRRIKRVYTTSKTDSLWDSIMESATQIKKISTKEVSEQEIKSALGIIKKITGNLSTYLGDSEITEL
ncbi:MarR family winged helix-turn-helix transcriptional regulator [Candidatus Nitrosotalea bavarica]|uniref:MarR family winged helix-turn-helix transcriptional regulator n=1 Tax=Candidatus Nitrosotalea bavarica TaxID=1903277 RepID=UPI0013FD760C|nr:MarR family winged helix-turn-helix transcriptional regulator [Candidatus Nitrosotalea bavarica]